MTAAPNTLSPLAALAWAAAATLYSVLFLGAESERALGTLLVIAAAGEIARAGTADQIALSVLFVVLGSSSVAGIAALGTFAPERSAGFLGRMRAWVTAHNRAVITAILLALGALLAARGLEGLL
jgi:hypothetical protein